MISSNHIIVPVLLTSVVSKFEAFRADSAMKKISRSSFRLAAMTVAFKNGYPLYLIHIDDDDTVGCVGSPVVDG